MPATQPNRQELMNAGPHHAKLRVTAHVASPVYVAGSEIAGKIDVECRAEKGLGLGTIMVELMAFQELNSRDHAATSTFIHTRRMFQGPSLPPSNAVLPEDATGRFPPNHYPARKGITTFFFRFPLPLTSPASVDFGSGLARIRYEVRASASVAWKGERRLVTDSQDIHVVESAIQEVESAGTVVGESGKIWVQGKVLGGAVVAGQTCCIELHVKNHSSRKTTGVNIAFQRVLHIDNPPPQHANLVLSDTLVTAAFHSPEYCCPPGLEGVAKLVINVPRTARTVKGGSRESGESGSDKTIPALFDIRASINVRLCVGVGAKDLVLNLPVVICHPAALTPEPAQGLGPPNQDAVFRSSSPQSLYEPPRSPFMPPQSPVLPYYTGHSPFPPASPSLPYTQVYFPPASPQPPNILNYFPAPPMSPGFPMTPTLPMSPAPPMSPVLPSSPAPPMSPVPPAPCMSPVHSYTPPNQVYGQAPAPQNHMYAPQPPVSPALPGTPRGPRALQLPPSQSMPQFGSQHTRIEGLPVQSPVRSPARSLPPLPPRPTSAEPQVHQVGVDLPPANTPLSPSAGRIQAPSEVPDSVEGKGTRALRISEHLRMSSRTRSVSPTGRRFPGPRVRPAPADPPPRVKDIEQERPDPELVYSPPVDTVDHTGSADTGARRPTAQDLERVAAEEAERASIRSAPQPSEPPRRNEPPPSPRRKPVNRSMSPDVTPPKQQGAKRTLPNPPVSPRKELRNAPPSPSTPSTKPKEVEVSPPKPQPIVTTEAPKPQGTPVLTVKPLEPMSTGLTALERRLTAKFESPGPPITSPLRKPAEIPEKPKASPKEESSRSIDWGEIARIGKLKSFALAKMKPALPAFTVPELPPASFVKPKPVVVRKPVPSIDEHEDRPVIPPTHSYPASPRVSKPPLVEIKPLVRYELTDGPVSPSRERDQGSAVILPESRPNSRPPSQHAPSPIVEAKPLVRYELTDGPVPKTSSAPGTPGSSATIVQLPPSSARTPVQAPRRPPVVTPVQTPGSIPAVAPAPVASPPTQHSIQTPVYGSSSPVLPTGMPMGTEPIRASPPEAIHTPPQPAPEDRLPPSSPIVAPSVPKHVQRYQLSDSPVSKPPTRYQLTDPPVSSPASAQSSAPNDVLMNHRANLRPISTSRPASPSKFEPRVAQAADPPVQPTRPTPAVSSPAPRSPTKEKFTPRAAPAPRIPSFPRPDDNPAPPERKEVSPPTQPRARSPARRNPSPQRAPQKVASPPTVPKANEPAAKERPRPTDAPRTQGESQAAQRAKYFESLAASKGSNPPPKPQPVQNTRNVLRPHQSNTVQVTAPSPQVASPPQVAPPQVAPPPRVAPPPQAAPAYIGQAPRQVRSPMETSPAARVTPAAEFTQDTPIRTRSPPRRIPSPVFTANPVPPTIPTARSLIPITSSGFEVPVVLPGRDARERAEAALREAELFRLKREAISRVPMWMSSDYIPQAPPPTRAIRSSNNMGPPQSYWDIQQPMHEEPTMAELLARDQPRAAYDPQLKHPRPRPVSSKPAAAALLPTDSQLLNKYDVRSARGGKGGQVTAITSLWQNGAPDATVPAESQAPQPRTKRYTDPAGMEPLATKFFSQTGEGAPASPLALGTGMTKSTSVPAMVHATQAVPVLSSTASLARPVGGPGVRTRMTSFAPAIPESQSDDTLVRRTSQPTEGVAVGQARLKELIGRYQS